MSPKFHSNSPRPAIASPQNNPRRDISVARSALPLALFAALLLPLAPATDAHAQHESRVLEKRIVSNPRVGEADGEAGASGDLEVGAQESEAVGIQLVSSFLEDGKRFDFYRNEDRSCGRSGFHTFVVASSDTTADSTSRPLWIRLLGGSAGWFDGSGNYIGGSLTKLDEWRDQMITAFREETGLMALIDDDPADFRILIPGMCDHDLYFGTGQRDTGNPFGPDPNGDNRKVDGLRAIRDAVSFTQQTYATAQKFVHGTSSGGVGATSYAIEYAGTGVGPDAIIVDTGTLSPYFAQLVDTGCTEYGNTDIRAGAPRFGWTMTNNGQIIETPVMPHIAVAAGLLDLPIYEIWSRNDHSVCGETQITITMEDGTRVTGESQFLIHSLFMEAIEQFNPGGNSVSRVVCADRPAGLVNDMQSFRRCGLHGITKWSSSSVGGDQDRGGEDYNQAIYNWITGMLPAQPAPPPVSNSSGSGALDPVSALLLLGFGTLALRARRHG